MRARRRALLALLAVLGLAVPVPAQPPASLKILIPADPGGSWDQMARAMEQALRTEKLVAGPIRLTNRGGGDGTVGLARFARVKGEAGSLMVMGQTMIAAIVTGGSPRTLASVTPIARLTSEPAVIVVPASSPFRTLKDLTERLKKDADTVSITGGSRGGSDHILAALIAESQGVPASRVNYVAYAGGGDAVAALLEARVAAGIGGWGELQAHVGSGKLRVLAISSPRRVPGINAHPQGSGSRHRVRQLARSGRARGHFRRRPQGPPRHDGPTGEVGDVEADPQKAELGGRVSCGRRLR